VGDFMTIVQQAVFGYDHGHRLLGGSFDLAPGQTRLLREISDARFSSQTERYVAVLPLPEARLVAAVATWPAPEAPRIGSVWGHVLMIEASQLTVIRDLTVLLAAFRRPTAGTLAGYMVPLDLSSVAPRTKVDWPPVAEVERVVVAAYATDNPVALRVHEPQRYEEVLFSLWSHQWPALRQHFSFRTRGEAVGASIERFSLQLAERISPQASSFLPTEVADEQPWVSAIAQNLRSSGCDTERFLWRYGSVDSPRRSQVPLMFEVDRLIGSARSAEEVVALVADRYPRASQMGELKQSLLGRRLGSDAIWPASEAKRLRLALGVSGAVDLDRLEVWPRLQELVDGDHTQLAEVANAIPSKLVDAAAKALGERVNASQAGALLDAQPRLGGALLRERADLLTDPRMWKRSENRETLIKAARRAPAADAVVVAALLAGDREAARRLLDQRAPLSVRFLNRLAARTADGDVTPQRAREWLAAADAAIPWAELNWGRVKPETFDMLLSAFGPGGVVQRAPAQHLLTVKRGADIDGTWAATLVLAALNRGGSDTRRELWRRGFPPVHLALAEERLPRSLWGLLDANLPDRGNGDRCERLRRAFAESIKSDRWSIEAVDETVARAGPEGRRIYDLLRNKKKPWYEQVADLFS
jgi:hypothetical protein